MLKKLEFSLNKLQDLPLLAIRLVLAYGFYEPAMEKVQDIHAIGDWFASLNIPAPYFQAYLATGTEILGVILLTLGLFTRIISFPLIITMIIAILTVHWENGFSSGNNGFEIPLYYIIMLITLICFGAGRISFDHLLIRKNTKAFD